MSKFGILIFSIIIFIFPLRKVKGKSFQMHVSPEFGVRDQRKSDILYAQRMTKRVLKKAGQGNQAVQDLKQAIIMRNIKRLKKALIENPLLNRQTDSFSRTLLIYAIEYDCTVCLDVLLNNKFSPPIDKADSSEQTPLIIAIRSMNSKKYCKIT